MIQVLNSTTGAITKVDLICNYDGVLAARKLNPEPGTKFYSTYPFIIKTDNTIEVEGAEKPCRVVELAQGYELKQGRAKKQPQGEPQATPQVEQAIDEPTTIEPQAAAVEPVQAQQPAPQATTGNDNEDELALIKAIKNLKGGSIDENRVRDLIVETLAQMAQQPAQAKAIKLAAKVASNSKEYFCKGFDKIVESVSRGFYPYLFGAAGCGKSHTAEQVAKALGLDFYSQTTIQFAHDVRGYGDAAGNFQETPFFKAFANGGLYFQDEYDRSMADAAIVLNTALANGFYDFPIVGRVEAHPNFRFMAAGNTMMKGAQDGYVTGNEQDASSRDRVFYIECEYNHEVELNAIAGGDTELVAFVEDCRKAVKACNIEHVISYRATKFMHEMADVWGLEDCLKNKTFAGLEIDTIREIYGTLKDKSNKWSQALENILK